MYLFDTDILTNIVKPRPSPRLLQRLGEVSQSQQFVSTITISEIVYGAEKSHRPAYHLNNLENVLLPAVNIAGFDAKAAYVCGRIRADLEKKGTPLDLADLEIASIAIANDFILVTNNTRHFERIEQLRYENWL
ncbi:type II toxin-antitoxin system VapC family toxin [Leucothrix pacifica]|uniref:PIN domain nuclease n=1 Tax=Leucothrix pacifica TaxID=1247513 RepID=A0A317CK72_9GAMM|nr:type II toxin-antitoxin system VapC family toxin [Leucothrix pacifica]PWQ97843.1 PIN domain nuclease [Leucothrix pacifica]